MYGSTPSERNTSRDFELRFTVGPSEALNHGSRFQSEFRQQLRTIPQGRRSFFLTWLPRLE